MSKWVLFFIVFLLLSCTKECIVYQTNLHNDLFDKTVDVILNDGLFFDQCQELSFRSSCLIETDFKIESITFKDRFGNKYTHEVKYKDCFAYIKVTD